MALVICSLGTISAQPVTDFVPPDLPEWSKIIDSATPALAIGALAIPAYELKNLKCITQEIFVGLQAKFGKLYVIDVSIDENETHQFLMRRPTRQHLEIIESYKGDVTKVNDFIIKNLVVAGNDKNALDDGVVYSQFGLQSAKIIQQGQSFLAKT
jgi:hypothetical protein